MSRSQQSTVLNTAEDNSKTDQTNATTALAKENEGIGDYETQLSKFAANNPYAEGGEFQTDTNKVLSGVADAGSGAVTNQLQTQAQRTGMNAGSSVATAAEVARENQRNLSSDEATAEKARIDDKSGYDQTVLNATEVPAELEAGEYGTSIGAGNQALNTASGAASTPGFWDTLGDSFASALGKTAGGGNAKK